MIGSHTQLCSRSARRGGFNLALLALAAGAAAVITLGAAADAKVPGPNGRIAFARVVGEEEARTFTANPDGSDVQPLYPGHHSEVPHWSPDGSEVAVLSDAGLPCCTVAAVIIHIDSGDSRVLPMEDPDRLFTPCVIWSPSGSRLACGGFGQTDPSLNGLYTIRSSDGGGLT